jgi:hypothetical protein
MLGFGHVFGVEFVELALGDGRETDECAGQSNLHGLHGNAVLSRFPFDRVALIPLDGGGAWYVSDLKQGQPVEDRIYNLKDMDRALVLEMRTQAVATKVTEFLKASDPFQKTIIFCDDIDHAERMRQALVNLNPERVRENRKYVMRITGDDQEGKAELDNFIDPERRYPVIATTSKLMTTGVDAQTCKLIVLDQHIKSMTEFKQIIGRGTRINEDYDKFWFTIMDFKKATELFADRTFDGDPVQIYEPTYVDSPVPPDAPPGGPDGNGEPGDDTDGDPEHHSFVVSQRCSEPCPFVEGYPQASGRSHNESVRDAILGSD